MSRKHSQESAALEQRREYYRRWRLEHKDAVRQYNVRYWMRRAEKAAAQKEGEYGNDGETSA